MTLLTDTLMTAETARFRSEKDRGNDIENTITLNKIGNEIYNLSNRGETTYCYTKDLNKHCIKGLKEKGYKVSQYKENGKIFTYIKW